MDWISLKSKPNAESENETVKMQGFRGKKAWDFWVEIVTKERRNNGDEKVETFVKGKPTDRQRYLLFIL